MCFPTTKECHKGIFLMFIVPLHFSLFLQYCLGSIVTIFTGIGFARSIQIRCILLLVFPTIFGRTGRSVLSTIVISYIIIGPINNLLLNVKEVIRCYSCSISLAVNLTTSRINLMKNPLLDILKDFDAEGKEMHKITYKITESFNPVKKEVEDDSEKKKLKDETDYVDNLSNSRKSRSHEIETRYKSKNKNEKKENNYRTKVEFRCEDVFNIGVLQCRKSMKKAEDRCMNALPIIGYLLCWPMKLTFFCNLVKLIPGKIVCDSMPILNPGFGEAFDTAEDAAEQFDTNFDVHLQYKFEIAPPLVDMPTPEDVKKGLTHEFQHRKSYFDFFVTMLQRFMALLFLRLFLSARNYNKNYLQNINYDNIYITKYFRKIDARRHEQDKLTLLPLKKLEKIKVIEEASLLLKGTEKKKFMSTIIRLSVQLFFGIIIIFLDSTFYDILKIVQRHSHIEYHQTGLHHISLTVFGTGPMSKIIRSIVKSFNTTHSLVNIKSNKECLPNPHPLNKSFINTIIVLFVGLFLLSYFEAFGMRQRHVITAFFFPKREKKRILYLYNDMLKCRKGYLGFMKRHVRKAAKEEKIVKKLGTLITWKEKYPRLLGWMTKFGWGIPKCLICSDPLKQHIKKCTTPDCNSVYCRQCWKEINKQCYVCHPDSDESSELTDMDLEEEYSIERAKKFIRNYSLPR